MVCGQSAILLDTCRVSENEDDTQSGQQASVRETGVAIVSDLLKRITVVADASEEAGLIARIAKIDKTIVVSFVNQHVMNLAWRLPNFAGSLIGSDILLRDGFGIERTVSGNTWTSCRTQHGRNRFHSATSTGFAGKRTALFGTKEPWTSLAAASLRHYGCEVVSVMDGFKENSDYLEEIRRSRPSSSSWRWAIRDRRT